jgi:UDP:flavonoid glycosyltransferase YjiC (YdhE family)
MGHLTRLLAIARRVPEPIKPFFLTMSQGLPVLGQFGFEAEYLPCPRSTLSSAADWNGWLAKTVHQILDDGEIRAVVFDGNLIYPGLASALAGRPTCPLIWVRRGMWRKDQNTSDSLASARHANLIIEPDDVASALDEGATSSREGVVVVDPISLLEPAEILARDDSCRTLGLDPGGRYVLIQLGAGNNSNVVDLVNSLVKGLDKLRQQPVIAEWLTSDFRFDLWPHVARLRCFPAARYLRAFDFVISAAGYNSFNELISFGVPSVLVPNRNRSMDDQGARASFAASRGAAVHLDDDMLPKLNEVLTSIADPKTRCSLSENCRRISKPNGAWQAADVIGAIAREAAP